ncbi:hypothetical protein TYRP_013081 [Tyrophagus putrescentiae]|nr:hypothetical protein TYRP_013081 [Tyrophagus putrescentiae]
MTNSKQLLGQHSVLLITVALLLLQAPDLGTPIQQHNLESTTGESSSEPAGTTASAGDNHDDGRINGGGGGDGDCCGADRVLFFPTGSYCNCSVCMKNLVKGEDCSDLLIADRPAYVRCGANLTCSIASQKCE